MNALKTADYCFDKALAAKNHYVNIFLFSAIAVFSIMLPINFTSNADGIYQTKFLIGIISFAAFVFFGGLYLSLKHKEYRYHNVMFCAGSHIEDIIKNKYGGKTELFITSDSEEVQKMMKRHSLLSEEEIKRGVRGYLVHIGRIKIITTKKD